MNHNIEQDLAIQAILPRARIEYDRLLTDPQIAASHDHAVAQHRAKITELRAQEAPATFYAELTSPRMERLCRLQKHFGSAVFMAGPQVVPDDVLRADLPANFFFTVKSAPDKDAGEDKDEDAAE
jgi:hypothetical protein